MGAFQLRFSFWLIIGGALVGAGCRSPHALRTQDYAIVASAVSESYRNPAAVHAAIPPGVAEFAGPRPVEDYIAFALGQNAGIQAAKSRVEATANRVPQAASLQDPMLSANGWPFYPYVPQTAGGRMTAEVMVSQQVPWMGKLRGRAEAAEAEVNAARARLAAEELNTIEEVKRAYYDLHLADQSIRITEQNRSLLAQVLQIAEARYQTGATSQQDVLRLQAEISSVDGDLVRLDQEVASARASLAELLHVSPDTPFQTVDELDASEVPRDLAGLYERAVAARPELHAMLAAIERDRRMVELAHLEYRPDFTFSVGWGEMTANRALAPSADGLDSITTGMSVNLPIYQKRLDAGVREAEATVVASAREYDQMRDETLREVKSLFAQAESQRELVRLFGESIIPSTEQALELAIREYQVGRTEFVQMIDNWRELLRLQVMYEQLQAQLRQTLASLARVVGSYDLDASPLETMPPPQPVPPLPVD
jgi:outer membrane protein TolC